MTRRGRAAARMGAALLAAGLIIPYAGVGTAFGGETRTASLKATPLMPAKPAARPSGKPAARKSQVGLASYYGARHRGKRTASGARFDDRRLTAAHCSLPLNSKAKVTNLKTGQSVDVTITDRGPYRKNRVIDLSTAAARQIGIDKKDGIDPVKVEPLGDGNSDYASIAKR